MQRQSELFDGELVALAQETRRVANSIDNSEVRARLVEIADDVIGLAYFGDRSNDDAFAAARAGLGLNWDDCPTA